MIKYSFLGIIAAVLVTACANKPSAMSEQEKRAIRTEVECVFGDFAKAAQSLDHEAYFSFMDADNFTFLGADGATLHSLKEFRDAYLPQLRAVKKYNRLAFDPLRVTVIDASHAIVVNEFSAEVVLKSGVSIETSGAGAQFWSKRSGEWKLVHISNSLKQ